MVLAEGKSWWLSARAQRASVQPSTRESRRSLNLRTCHFQKSIWDLDFFHWTCFILLHLLCTWPSLKTHSLMGKESWVQAHSATVFLVLFELEHMSRSLGFCKSMASSPLFNSVGPKQGLIVWTSPCGPGGPSLRNKKKIIHLMPWNFLFALSNMQLVRGLWSMELEGLYNLSLQTLKQCFKEFRGPLFTDWVKIETRVILWVLA